MENLKLSASDLERLTRLRKEEKKLQEALRTIGLYEEFALCRRCNNGRHYAILDNDDYDFGEMHNRAAKCTFEYSINQRLASLEEEIRAIAS